MTNPNVQKVIEMIVSIRILVDNAILSLNTTDDDIAIRANIAQANGALYRAALDLDDNARAQVITLHTTIHAIMLAQIPVGIYITNKVERNRTMASNYRTIISHAETTVKMLEGSL